MCRLARLGTLVLAFALASVQGLHARQTADDLRARLDSLRPVLETAQAAALDRERRDLDAMRLSAAAIATMDTLRVGLMTIITPVDQADVARDLFAEVWNETFHLIRRSPSLEEARFAFQWSGNAVPIHVEKNEREVKLDSKWIRRPNVKRAIQDAIGATLNFDLRREDTEIVRWVSGTALRAHDMERVYRAIVTTQSRVTRACMEGAIDACVSALGLNDDQRRSPERSVPALRDVDMIHAWEAAQVQRLQEWYTEDERRLLVARMSRFQWSNGQRGVSSEWEECVQQRMTATCDRALAETWQDFAPLPGSVRESVLAFAIERGGAGAWERLIEDPAMPPSDALAYTASLPLTELVRSWRDEVIAGRPDAFDDFGRKSGLTLMWVLLFGAFAMRSERCRLG